MKSPVLSRLPAFLGNIQKQKLIAGRHKGLALATFEAERKNVLDLNLVVGVDCSGSISRAMFQSFMTQVNQIKGMSRIKVVEVSDRIEAVYDFTRPRADIVRLKGGGGNGEHLFFPLAKSMKPDAILYMTDGYCTEAKNPHIPTAWILTKEGIQPYPWGEVVCHLPQ
jgi:predicted metal-dependent peptidase